MDYNGLGFENTISNLHVVKMDHSSIQLIFCLLLDTKLIMKLWVPITERGV